MRFGCFTNLMGWPLATNLSAKAHGASIGLLYINILTLIIFLVMGYLSPRLYLCRRCRDASVAPYPVLVFCYDCLFRSGCQLKHHFAAFCLIAWPLSATHPLIGQHFEEAGRAIAFINLAICRGLLGKVALGYDFIFATPFA